MRRAAVILLMVLTTSATGCVGGALEGSGMGTTATPTRMEITYFGALHRRCPTNDPCGVSTLDRIACPAGSRCVSPARGAELVRCPMAVRAGIHCYALAQSGRGRDPWVILQQRELSCDPARGGYADPAAACRALGDYLRRLQNRGPQMCMCPFQLWKSRATGMFRGRRVALDVAPCATCGMGRAAIADREALTPALGS